jgi:RimJ/RimL family protein N-acetyltransferase
MGTGIHADRYAVRVLRRFDTIRTARLVMRRWRDADRDAFAAMNADPVVMRYSSGPGPGRHPRWPRSRRY